MIGRINKIMTEEGLSKADAGKVQDLMKRFDQVLAIMEPSSQAQHDKLGEIEELVRQRQRARAEKNWAEADRCRDALERDYNIILEDRAEGTAVVDKDTGKMVMDMIQ
jgi:cysteinyl-tRNA synthetase